MSVVVITEGSGGVTGQPVTIIPDLSGITPVVRDPQAHANWRGPQGVQGLQGPVGSIGPIGPIGATGTGIIPGSVPYFLQSTAPVLTGAYMWMQTGLGDGTGFTLWMEDGL